MLKGLQGRLRCFSGELPSFQIDRKCSLLLTVCYRPLYWSILKVFKRFKTMLEEIGSYEAKTKLPEILRRVETGETFTITNRGKPIADVIPSRSSDKQKTQTAIANIMQARKHNVSDELLNELKGAGRK